MVTLTGNVSGKTKPRKESRRVNFVTYDKEVIKIFDNLKKNAPWGGRVGFWNEAAKREAARRKRKTTRKTTTTPPPETVKKGFFSRLQR